MHRALIILVSFTLLVVATSLRAQPTSQPRPQSAAELHVILMENLRKLQNLHVEGELHQEDLVSGVWTETQPPIILKAWRADPWSDLARIDYPAQGVSLAFDGKTGRTIGHGGAIIDSKVPDRLVDALFAEAYGAAYSIFFRRDPEGRSLVQQLDPPTRLPGLPVSVSTTTWEGQEAVLAEFGPINTVTYKWWLDPSRGYALLGFQWIVQRGDRAEIADEYRATNFTEAAPGIWYPVEGYRTSEMQPQRRLRYKAAKVVINDPQFNRSIFAPAIPADFTITDKIRGRTIKPSARSPIRIALDAVFYLLFFATGTGGPVATLLWITARTAVALLLLAAVVAYVRKIRKEMNSNK